MVDSNFLAFCRDPRIRFKDARWHRFVVDAWPTLLASESLDRESVLRLRQAKLELLVGRIVQGVPFYERWARESGWRVGDPLRIDDLPAVGKDEYRAEPDAFIARDAPRDELRVARTSGSTGTPFRFLYHSQSSDLAYGGLWRALRRHGLRPGDRRAYAWGRSWSFASSRWRNARTRARLRLRDWLNVTCSIDAYDLSDANVAREIGRVERFRPVYLHGYVSALYTLARHVLDRGRPYSAPAPKLAVTESEALLPHHRATIERAFGCRVAEHYGAVGFGNIAQEDPAGHLRVNDDLVWLESVHEGEALATDLGAFHAPLIRFRLGDLVELSDEIPPGLPYTVIRRIVGRTTDRLPLVRGGFVHGVALAHTIDPHLDRVKRYQLEQRAAGRFLVRLVPASPGAVDDATLARIRGDMLGLLGEPTEIEFALVERIEPDASGKTKLVSRPEA